MPYTHMSNTNVETACVKADFHNICLQHDKCYRYAIPARTVIKALVVIMNSMNVVIVKIQ